MIHDRDDVGMSKYGHSPLISDKSFRLLLVWLTGVVVLVLCARNRESLQATKEVGSMVIAYSSAWMPILYLLGSYVANVLMLRINYRNGMFSNWAKEDNQTNIAFIIIASPVMVWLSVVMTLYRLITY